MSKARLQPISVRVPTVEFHRWNGTLQPIAPVGENWQRLGAGWVGSQIIGQRAADSTITLTRYSSSSMLTEQSRLASMINHFAWYNNDSDGSQRVLIKSMSFERRKGIYHDGGQSYAWRMTVTMVCEAVADVTG